ncbi:hypothetical protein M569_10053, partial [Genlisea aurea]
FLLLLLFPCCCYSVVERNALLSWKQSLSNSSSSSSPAALALSSWNASDESPCAWFGIACDSEGNVEKVVLKSVDLQGMGLPANFRALPYLNTLVLSSANLSGEIPAEFGEYAELVRIDVSDNAISGGIPAEICRLSKLEVLSMEANFLEGSIPWEIGNLAGLKELLLYDNQLSGEIPRSVGRLRNLQVFRAGGNQNLTGEIPWEIGNCTELLVLGLAATAVSGSLPSSIGMLRKLQTLAAYTAMLSGSIPEEIGNCTQLQNLYLYQNAIPGPIPETVGQLGNLRSVLLWQNRIEGTIPVGFGRCPELKVVDLSENRLTGGIPASFGGLIKLEELQLSANRLSGSIPPEITNCTSLIHLEVDNNYLSGDIPPEIGKLETLTLFFAWRNNLTGAIPESLSRCDHLQDLDLSYNGLSGNIPAAIFGSKNLTKLLLISNKLTGIIPPDIGNATNLYRFRISDNGLVGTVPSEIGNLKSLNFLDMGNNQFEGSIPSSISGCETLEFLDLHSNGFTGPLPYSLPKSLQFVDISNNRLTGSISGIGSLTELTKINIGNNQFSGRIPPEIANCSRLQMLDLGNNGFSGDVPKELGQLPSLEISLNLSCNRFTGGIPSEFSGLAKLGVLDLSHNKLSGNLEPLRSLQNLVTLNVSFNEFSGELPDTPFFHKLPLSDLSGNRNLQIPGGVKSPADNRGRLRTTMMAILVCSSVVLVLLGLYFSIKTRISKSQYTQSDTWEMKFYQKFDFSIDEIVKGLNSSNVIGTGSSGVVYKVTTPDGEALAVKKMWSSEESGAFNSEIRTLGSIRHKNIVRLLGWGSNQALKLLFYDYLPNGSLSSLLHGPGKGGAEWETRYDIILGIGHALAYLHHDCVPPIMHGDVKAMNVLLGLQMEPYLADFGLAKLVNNDRIRTTDSSKQSPQRPHLAGSYGYMAPEHASAQRITEKSDVYSFGVVLLEVLTGRHPLDPTLPGGIHMVQWVRDHLHKQGNPVDIIDPKLRGRSDPQVQEMLQTFAIAFLCLSTRADDRPMMKDVVAMLKEIRFSESATTPQADLLKKSLSTDQKQPVPHKNEALQGSSSCSFVFTDESV